MIGTHSVAAAITPNAAYTQANTKTRGCARKSNPIPDRLTFECRTSEIERFVLSAIAPKTMILLATDATKKATRAGPAATKVTWERSRRFGSCRKLTPPSARYVEMATNSIVVCDAMFRTAFTGGRRV